MYNYTYIPSSTGSARILYQFNQLNKEMMAHDRHYGQGKTTIENWMLFWAFSYLIIYLGLYNVYVSIGTYSPILIPI